MSKTANQAKQIKYAKELYEILRELLLHIHGPLCNLKPVIDRGYELIDRIDNESHDSDLL